MVLHVILRAIPRQTILTSKYPLSRISHWLNLLSPSHLNAYLNPNLTTWAQAGYTFPRNSAYEGC